ncbi:MAG: dTDP-4-dehydrorhamnose reductase [Candidatus Pseudobacter hemicellulosilyticus]|uniref:dTDP-4-dehydrorhamnose reductase n=1 Tax=Candidatus Pseudobacter hemicellulosilyticus TaxID=3121375 RepID=A0AAJ6BHA3_9BACT|nr:MAG: dTDP-4-dehydrorhamnose reductase [Pseudobacter sp.]
MSKPIVLVTGAYGQLGREMETISRTDTDREYILVDRDDLPIQNAAIVEKFFYQYSPAYCVNAAAYTAVDKAETDAEEAYLINGDAVGLLAAACKQHGTKFVHVSTDYVFDGNSPEPYTETAPVNPMNVYGLSKLKGEALCLMKDPDAIIIRTAWVYSEFGNNFVKTMLRLMKERPSLNVVSDQVGAPTYAADLAAMISRIVTGGPEAWLPGIYHYSNQGRISWYDFAVAIRDLAGLDCTVNPISTDQYPTPAKRPSFSLLDTSKIRSSFNCDIPDWKDSLHRCMQQLKALA